MRTAGEECDDGNRESCDGCDPTCRTEPTGYRCGDGVVSGACGEECDDGGMCIGSANPGDGCAAARGCPGGTCQTFGGDGCAANRTRERDVLFDLVPGRVEGQSIVAGTSGAVLWADIVTIPLPFSGSQTLTIGKERDGQMPVVIKAASVHFTRISPAPVRFRRPLPLAEGFRVVRRRSAAWGGR